MSNSILGTVPHEIACKIARNNHTGFVSALEIVQFMMTKDRFDYVSKFNGGEIRFSCNKISFIFFDEDTDLKKRGNCEYQIPYIFELNCCSSNSNDTLDGLSFVLDKILKFLTQE